MRYRCAATTLVGLLAAVTLAASCGTEAEPTAEQGRQRLGQAVEHARLARTFRVTGELHVGGAALAQWQGVVDGADEQELMRTQGLLIDTRRLDGASWARRVDPTGPWQLVPYDSPLDLGVLNRGVVERVEHGESWLVTVEFRDIDVLYALTHIPSTGPTTARVTVGDDALDVRLQLGGDADATLHFGDFGAVLHVVPPRKAPALG